MHSIIIHNVSYIPESPIIILSPQEWSQQAVNNHPKSGGALCVTKAVTETSNSISKYTRVPYHSILSPTQVKYSQTPVPMLTTFSSRQLKKTL